MDTEFTSFERPTLLSLGMSSCTGAEHYAELDLHAPGSDAIVERCHAFVRDGDVLAQWGQLPGTAGTFAVMAQRTADWLATEARRVQERFGQPALLAFDHALDFALLRRLLWDHGHWPRIKPLLTPVDVHEWESRLPGGLERDRVYERLDEMRGLRRHHALADAIALRSALHAINTNQPL